MKTLNCETCGEPVRCHPATTAVRCANCTTWQKGDGATAQAGIVDLARRGMPRNETARKAFAWEANLCFARAGFGVALCQGVEAALTKALRGEHCRLGDDLLALCREAIHDAPLLKGTDDDDVEEEGERDSAGTTSGLRPSRPRDRRRVCEAARRVRGRAAGVA